MSSASQDSGKNVPLKSFLRQQTIWRLELMQGRGKASPLSIVLLFYRGTSDKHLDMMDSVPEAVNNKVMGTFDIVFFFMDLFSIHPKA